MWATRLMCSASLLARRERCPGFPPVNTDPASLPCCGAIEAARRTAVALLGERLAATPDGPFARAALTLEGWSGDTDRLFTELRQNRARDAAAGRALAGPHRADLAVTHLGKGQAAALASTGEQKALLLGIVLAHAELVAQRTGHAPVLLLDEVAAHLDPVRRAALFERLRQGTAQVWLTGTELAPFIAIEREASLWRVNAGQVERI